MSTGGTEIRVWDAFAGGRLLAKLCQHHRTVTCLCLGSGNRRLLSGSLDRHVKIYDISSYQVVHTLDYPNAVLSLDVSVSIHSSYFAQWPKNKYCFLQLS
jgi:U3 small nucleolar RNA-associated protein 15